MDKLTTSELKLERLNGETVLGFMESIATVLSLYLSHKMSEGDPKKPLEVDACRAGVLT